MFSSRKKVISQTDKSNFYKNFSYNAKIGTEYKLTRLGEFACVSSWPTRKKTDTPNKNYSTSGKTDLVSEMSIAPLLEAGEMDMK